MKKVFDDETARELGYQKYHPERKDWLMAIGGVLLFMVLVYGVTFGIMKQNGYLDRENKRLEDRKSAITEWCATSTVKNLAETKECLSYK